MLLKETLRNIRCHNITEHALRKIGKMLFQRIHNTLRSSILHFYDLFQ